MYGNAITKNPDLTFTYRKVRCVTRDNVQDAPPKVEEKTTGPLEYTHLKNAEIYQSMVLPNS